MGAGWEGVGPTEPPSGGGERQEEMPMNIIIHIGTILHVFVSQCLPLSLLHLHPSQHRRCMHGQGCKFWVSATPSSTEATNHGHL